MYPDVRFLNLRKMTMKLFPRLSLVAVFCLGLLGAAPGCQQEKKTEHKITIEGPEKKHELKVETTEKKN
jgi:hypothetical protein